jgi:hypothetical protein
MVQYKLDTGAQVNVLPYEIYQTLSSRPQLHEASTRLFAYGTVQPIPVKGQCVCEVTLVNGGCRRLRFCFRSRSICAVPLLGLQACDQLNLVKKVEAVTSTEMEDDLPSTFRVDEIVEDYLDLFDSGGVMEGGSYKIRLVDSAQPYSLATARRVHRIVCMTRVTTYASIGFHTAG